MPKRYLLYIILLALFVHSCNTITTTTVATDPAFNIEHSSIEDSLKKKIQFENFDVRGLNITTNGKSKSTLEINIFNGQKLPDDQEQLEILARQIAGVVKQSLKDTSSYDAYSVIFENKEAKGLITKKQVRTVTFSPEG